MNKHSHNIDYENVIIFNGKNLFHIQLLFGTVVRVSRRKQMIFDKSNKKTFRQIINIDFKLAAFVNLMTFTNLSVGTFASCL